MKSEMSNPDERMIMTDRVKGRSDTELLMLSMAGDEDAFLLLYEQLKAPVFRYAFYMTGSQASAEEVVQEVFISLLKNGNRYKPARGDLPGFVFGIARNLIRRLKKRESVTEALPGEAALDRKSLYRVDDCRYRVDHRTGGLRVRLTKYRLG